MTQEESFKYNTDKFNFHEYFPFYDKHFSMLKEVKNVMEIGIANGGSLMFFKDYFPNAEIIGVDYMKKNRFNQNRITTIVGNQESRDDLYKIKDMYDNFDLIIDDGGHTMKQQQTTFGVLFSKIKSGGIFVIEDLHTSTKRHKTHQSNNDEITTLDMVKLLQSTGIVKSNYITDEEKDYIVNNVGDIDFFSKTECYTFSSTCVIYKK